MVDRKIDKLTHPVDVHVLPSSGLKLKIEANEAEGEALARDVEILSIESFKAELLFRRWRKDGISLKGRIFANVAQQCVITLEPVHSEIVEDFERVFLPEGSKLAKPEINAEGEMILDPEGQDIPDLFAGKTLDAWSILTEHLQLALDPFPRALGATLAEFSDIVREGTEDEVGSPFAALAALKADKKK